MEAKKIAVIDRSYQGWVNWGDTAYAMPQNGTPVFVLNPNRKASAIGDHSKGDLRVAEGNILTMSQAGILEGSKQIASCENSLLAAKTVEANARRLAACWHFCADLETDVLELACHQSAAAVYQSRYQSMRKQRDDLLEVVNLLIKNGGTPDVLARGKFTHNDICQKMWTQTSMYAYTVDENGQPHVHDKVVLNEDGIEYGLWSEKPLEAFLGDRPLLREFQGVIEEMIDKAACTEPSIITKEKFIEMLEVLPPVNWWQSYRFECFALSERKTGNVTSWWVRFKDVYMTFDNIIQLDKNAVAAIAEAKYKSHTGI